MTNEPVTLVDLLAAQGNRHSPAFTHVEYRSGRHWSESTLTWSDLYRRVRATAVQIQRTVARGDRVAVLVPQDLDYAVAFLAALAAGVIAVPLSAPEATAHGDRLVGALRDCAPRVWLTASGTERQVRQLADGQPVPRPERVFVVDRVDSALAADYVPTRIGPSDPAYVQYSSGSTKQPAGVLVTHGAAVASARQVVAAFGLAPSFTCVGWIPFFHDMGLVGAVVVPVLLGGRTVFTAPFTFIRRPVTWLSLLARYPDTFTAAPNFAFDYAVARITEKERAVLDLRGVRAMINSSEPVRPATVAAFDAAFGPQGLAPEAHRPAYGLAEATVLVSTTRTGAPPRVTAFGREELGNGHAVAAIASAEGAARLVSVGRPAGQYVQVVDPSTRQRRPDGTVGELWVHGPNVACGYWAKPELAAGTFDAELIDPPDGVPSRPWLRTGDMGVVFDGELYITGRVKDVIIIDGRNHYPQDIEATVQEAHPLVRRDRVAVFGVESAEREGVVVVAECASGRPERAAEITAAIRRAVSAVHAIRPHDVVLARPGAVVRTSSGKIARTATRTSYLNDRYR